MAAVRRRPALPLYYEATRLEPEPLRALRERAVAEVVHGALAGADAAHMTKVAGLVLACDRRLTRH